MSDGKKPTLLAEVFKNDFQTPPEVCKYMASLVPDECRKILEPTAGSGNLKKALENFGFDVTAPDDFFLLPKIKFDAVVMNPPFSEKFTFLENAPESYTSHKGMKVGYRILVDCMELADKVIALMPWFTISDSDRRLRYLKSYGLKAITALPRKTFQYTRIQTMVLELDRNHQGTTEFKVFDYLSHQPSIMNLSNFKQEVPNG